MVSFLNRKLVEIIPLHRLLQIATAVAFLAMTSMALFVYIGVGGISVIVRMFFLFFSMNGIVAASATAAALDAVPQIVDTASAFFLQKNCHSGKNMEQLAKIFNRKASEYHRYRPGYPRGISEKIISVLGLRENCQILEIGCGTGQATALFTGLKPTQICIDPGTELLRECKASNSNLPGYSFVCSTFENFEAQPASFDLIYAATCFHWLKPGRRFKKAAFLLTAQGGLAVFTHQHKKQKNGFFAASQAVYKKFAPELIASPPKMPAEETFIEENSLTLLHQSELDRNLAYRSDEYVGLLKTFSGHIALGEKRLNKLCDAIHTLIETRYGGRIIKTVTTNLAIYGKDLSIASEPSIHQE
jgi:ubiquinone/menaquinone biosynthesis C-methylase UbiE